MTIDEHRSQYRLPNSLYERLKAAAEKNRRSINAEMVVRLEASFDQQDTLVDRFEQMLAERDARMLEQLRLMMLRGG